MVVALLLLQKIEAIDQSIGTGNEGARCGGVAPFALSLSDFVDIIERREPCEELTEDPFNVVTAKVI